MKKLIFFVVLSLIFTSVFAIWDMNPKEAYWNLLKHTYMENKELSYDYAVFKWTLKPSIDSMKVTCKADIQYIDSINFNHIYRIDFSYDCKDREFLSADWYTWKIKFDIKKTGDLFNKYTDYPSSHLINLSSSLNNFIKENSHIKNKAFDKKSYLENIKLKNSFYFASHLKFIIDSILEWRNKKYSSPVSWKNIVDEKNKIPNAWRPYRSSYTDWIHHWWDIYWEIWEKTVALDDWVIIRVVDNFKFSDINKRLVKDKNLLTEDRKFLNLDVLRWNQVWLKTLKWDVVFYSHLDSIPKEVVPWKMVERWDVLWYMWVSGVPELWYKDIHLHFTIHKNPYNKEKAWKYNFLDIMKWKWYFEWETLESTIKHQHNIFQK